MVDTATLTARVKTKGVKKATSELDKFGKEARDTEKSTGKMNKAATAAFSAFKVGAGILAGAAVSVGALAKKAADAEKQWRFLAQVSNDSVQSFKASAFAAEQFGISAEKLGDISKDTKEKLGEFIATGGGGFKDFFEQVAPVVGLTAKELEHLSGTEVLQKVKNAMDEANIPMAQQSFYLESIASDTTALIPLLSKEGAELERLTSKYNRLNNSLALSASQQGGLKQTSEAFNLLGETASNALSFVVGNFAPEFKGAIEGAAEAISGLAESFVFFINSFRDGTEANLLSRFADNTEEIFELEQKIGKSRSNASRRRLTELRKENDKISEQLKLLRETEKAEEEAAEASQFKPVASQTNQTLIDDLKQEKEVRIQIRRETADELYQIEFERQRKEEQLRMQNMNNIGSAFGNVSSLMNTENKKLFEIGKAAAYANAVVSTAAGITKALELGPIIGPALASSIAVAGGVQISTIESQKFTPRAQGGQTSGLHMVGENGRELVNLGSGGRIANNADTEKMLGGGGNAPQVIVNNYASGTKAEAQTMTDGRVMVIVKETLRGEVLSPNSQFNKDFNATRKSQRQF